MKIIIGNYNYKTDELLSEDKKELIDVIKESIKSGCPVSKGDVIITESSSFTLKKRYYSQGLMQFWFKE